MNSALRQFFALVFAAVASTAGAQSTFILGPYQYDGSGNVTGVGMDAQYRYDAYGRLGTSQIYVNGNLHAQEFTYDRFGNITTIATNGTPMNLGVSSATNRLTTAVPAAGIFGTHDDDGNMTSYIGSTTFEPDELGMVRRAELEGHKKVYLYTADEERIATIGLTPAGVEDDSLWTLRDLSGKVLREYRKTTASGEQWQWREDYVYRGGALLAAEVPGDTLHFHPDHLGTPRLITNALGAKVSEHTYAPFGIELTPAGTQRMKFTGHERDVPNLDQPTLGKALDYMHARYYTPGGGRFLSVDPGKDWDPKQPQSWNMYAYVQNDPVNGTDPTGRFKELKSLAGIFDRFKAESEQLSRAFDAAKQTPVLKVSARYGPPGGEIKMGSFEAGVTVEVGLKGSVTEGTVTAEIKGLLGGGKPGAEKRLGGQTKVVVYGDHKVFPNGFDSRVQVAGQLGAVRANESEVTARLGSGVIGVEAGFNYRKAGEAVGRTLVTLEGVVKKLADPIGLVLK